MSMLKGILLESKKYYQDTKQKIEKKLKSLPKGSIKEREISGKNYYYLQKRIGGKVIHKYLGRDKPEELLKQIQERKRLEQELKKVDEALKILRRSEKRKHG